MHQFFYCKNNMFLFLIFCISLNFSSFSLAGDIKKDSGASSPSVPYIIDKDFPIEVEEDFNQHQAIPTAHATIEKITQEELDKVTDYLEELGYNHFEVVELLQEKWDYYTKLVSSRISPVKNNSLNDPIGTTVSTHTGKKKLPSFN